MIFLKLFRITYILDEIDILYKKWQSMSFWSPCTFCSGPLLRFPRADQSSPCLEPAAFGHTDSISALGSNGQWYHVSGEDVPAGQWVSYCETGGMQLARIDTQEDFEGAIGFLGKNGVGSDKFIAKYF